MKIGIDASFLRKSGTGIGQVTFNFINSLMKLKESGIRNQESGIRNQEKIHDSQFILYTEEPIDFDLPANFENKHFLPRWWKRDDVPRKWLWERQVAREAEKDGCDVFISLYQSATVFSPTPQSRRLDGHSTLSSDPKGSPQVGERGERKMRHVMVVHDIIPRLFPEYLDKATRRMHWNAIEKGISGADHIVAISESTKRDLVEHLGILEVKITVAYPDVSPRFREVVSDRAVDAVLEKYGLERGYIYHGGGLEVRKNAEGVLRAYSKLRFNNQSPKSNNQIPPLVISGKIFDTSNKLATDVVGLVEELGLAERVKLLGFVPDEDMSALYRGAAFFVYPSLYEGFGLPVVEALVSGIPVLASDTSSLPEAGGDAVLYCDPHDIDSIVSGMERLLTDEALRQELVSKSAAQVIRFDWGKFVEKVFDVLRS